MRPCSKCVTNKEATEYYVSIPSMCKDCVKIRQRAYNATHDKIVHKQYNDRTQDRRKKYRDLNVNKSKQYRLMYKFNITEDAYQDMFDKQEGKCAICKKPEKAVLRGVIKRLAVDHCHKTNEIRGLLCTACNTKLGVLEQVDFVEQAKNYLIRHKEKD